MKDAQYHERSSLRVEKKATELLLRRIPDDPELGVARDVPEVCRPPVERLPTMWERSKGR